MQEIKEACRFLVRLEPMLCVYSELVRWYVAVCMGTHRSTGKLLSVLANLFTDLGQKVESELLFIATVKCKTALATSFFVLKVFSEPSVSSELFGF